MYFVWEDKTIKVKGKLKSYVERNPDNCVSSPLMKSNFPTSVKVEVSTSYLFFIPLIKNTGRSKGNIFTSLTSLIFRARSSIDVGAQRCGISNNPISEVIIPEEIAKFILGNFRPAS
ncbi:hypothetical protein ES705_24192 [subsurface metagenome]